MAHHPHVHATPQPHRVHLHVGDDVIAFDAPHGARLRDVLLSHGHSPHGAWTQTLNCGGRGLCATCGVWFLNHEPAPTHWHDKAACAYGYPRLSCQVQVTSELRIALVDGKKIWGSRDPGRRQPMSDEGIASEPELG